MTNVSVRFLKKTKDNFSEVSLAEAKRLIARGEYYQAEGKISIDVEHFHAGEIFWIHLLKNPDYPEVPE